MTTLTETGQPLSVGAVVADAYQVTRLLGRGGMGSVWEASHLRLPGKKVAIKVLHAMRMTMRTRIPATASAKSRAQVRAELIDGERALRHGAGPAGHALRARASCAIGDLGNARASFVRLGRRPFLRRQVLSFCTRNGVDLGP